MDAGPGVAAESIAGSGPQEVGNSQSGNSQADQVEDPNQAWKQVRDSEWLVERYGNHVQAHPLSSVKKVAGTKQLEFNGCKFNLKYSGKASGSQQTYECIKRRSLGCVAQILILTKQPFILAKHAHNHSSRAEKQRKASDLAAQTQAARITPPIAKPRLARSSRLASPRWLPPQSAPLDSQEQQQRHHQHQQTHHQHQHQQQHSQFQSCQQPAVPGRSATTIVAQLLAQESATQPVLFSVQILPHLVVTCASQAQIASLARFDESADSLSLAVNQRPPGCDTAAVVNVLWGSSAVRSTSVVATIFLSSGSLGSFRKVADSLSDLLPRLTSVRTVVSLPFLPNLHAALREKLPCAILRTHFASLGPFVGHVLGQVGAAAGIVQRVQEVLLACASRPMSEATYSKAIADLQQAVPADVFRVVSRTWLANDASFPPQVWAARELPTFITNAQAIQDLVAGLMGTLAQVRTLESCIDLVQRAAGFAQSGRAHGLAPRDQSRYAGTGWAAPVTASGFQPPKQSAFAPAGQSQPEHSAHAPTRPPQAVFSSTGSSFTLPPLKFVPSDRPK